MQTATLVSNRFRESVNKIKDKRISSEAEFNVGYPTGFLNFDFKNGVVIHVKTEIKEFSYYSVGVTDGSMFMIIGRSGSGKTTFAVQSAGNIVRRFRTSCIVHEDIENGISTQRIQQLTGFTDEEMQNKYIRRSIGITAENFYQRIKIMHDIKLSNYDEYSYDTGYVDPKGFPIIKLEPTVWILDSLALLMPEDFADEEELSGQMSSTAAAKKNAAIFKRITPMLKSANIILMVINHITENVDIGIIKKKAQLAYLKQGEALPGGKTPVYLSNLMVRLDDTSKLRADEGLGIDGAILDLGFIKSRNSKAGQSIKLVLNQDTGYDVELGLYLMLKDMNRINGAGAYYYIGDRSDKKFAQKNLKAKLKEDIEFREIFSKEVESCLAEIINDHGYMGEQRQEDYNLSYDILDRMNNVV